MTTYAGEFAGISMLYERGNMDFQIWYVKTTTSKNRGFVQGLYVHVSSLC